MQTKKMTPQQRQAYFQMLNGAIIAAEALALGLVLHLESIFPYLEIEDEFWREVSALVLMVMPMASFVSFLYIHSVLSSYREYLELSQSTSDGKKPLATGMFILMGALAFNTVTFEDGVISYCLCLLANICAIYLLTVTLFTITEMRMDDSAKTAPSSKSSKDSDDDSHNHPGSNGPHIGGAAA